MINDTSFTPNAEQASDIVALQKAMEELSEIPVTSEGYAPAVAQATEAVKRVGRIHRNWNEVTGEPDGLYEAEEDDPQGAQPPKIDHDDLTSFEATIEALIYFLSSANLDAPKLASGLHFYKAMNEVGELTTYHPGYDINRGMIME